jgi:hypothetical protein
VTDHRPASARLCAGLCLLLLLAGCQRTLLSQAPVADAGCDQALQGQWTSLGGDGSQPGEVEATLGADCRLSVIERRPEGPRAWPPITLASLGGSGDAVVPDGLLWLDATATNAAFEIASGPVDRAGAVYAFAYRLEGDLLTLRRPDHRGLAHRLVDGGLDGAVLVDGSDLVVRLDGEPDALAALMREPASFTDQDTLRFRRVDVAAGE